MLGYITDPAARGGLDRRDLPEPEPTPHQAVIEVAAYAINRGELALLSQRPNDWTPGQDVAGVVVGAAADGTGPAVGTRVVGLAALRTLRTGGPLLGRCVLVTGASGGVGSFAGECSQIAFFDFNSAQPGGRLEGFRIYATDEETFGEDLGLFAGMVADGRLDPRHGAAGAGGTPRPRS